jgi:hypothetical protein
MLFKSQKDIYTGLYAQPARVRNIRLKNGIDIDSTAVDKRQLNKYQDRVRYRLNDFVPISDIHVAKVLVMWMRGETLFVDQNLRKSYTFYVKKIHLFAYQVFMKIKNTKKHLIIATNLLQ